jgi:hypothetical protein
MVFIVPPLICTLRRLFVSIATVATGERNTRVREPSIQFYAGIGRSEAPYGKEVFGIRGFATTELSHRAALTGGVADCKGGGKRPPTGQQRAADWLFSGTPKSQIKLSA